MVSRGVVAGDRIALIVDNSVEWAATAVAANAVGALYTAMYTQQHGKEWAYILGDSTPSMVVVASTAVLDKLVASMPDDASAWPANGIVLLGEDEANEVRPRALRSSTGRTSFKPVAPRTPWRARRRSHGACDPHLHLRDHGIRRVSC